MTPITIEPNSGTKMAGVKIRQSGWNVDYYEEIVFITNSSILLRDKNNGIESLCRIDCRDGWYLYEEPKAEPKAEVKCQRVAVDKIKNSFVFREHDHYIPCFELENGDIVQVTYAPTGNCWVTNFIKIKGAHICEEGFLIIPEEFK